MKVIESTSSTSFQFSKNENKKRPREMKTISKFETCTRVMK